MGKIWYPEADLVILHGTIYTCAITVEEIWQGKSEFPIIRDGGIAVKDGKIIAVGQADDMCAFIGEHTEKIDATNKVITPGFCESHMHASFFGAGLVDLDLGAVTSRAEMFPKIKAFCEPIPDGKWALGNSWNNNVWTDSQEMLTCRELDEVAPNNPLFLMSNTYHTACCNSAALKIAGITRDTPDPAGGSIGHYPDGEPNGILYENSGMNLVQAVIPAKTDDDRVYALELAGKEMARFGITSAIDANLSLDQLRAYKVALDSGKLYYRANPMYYLDSAMGDKDFHMRRLEELTTITGYGNEMLKFNAIKVTLDGVPATYTSLMRKPYRTRPDFYGTTIWTQEEITEFVCKANELGWQFGIHAIGDGTEDMALAAFAESDRRKPAKHLRNYLIHYVIPHEDQWPIMRELGIAATQQPTIACTMGELKMQCFQPEDERRNQGSGLLWKNGILCGGSSDCPVVTCDPLTGMYHAVKRIDETCGELLGEECKVTPQQALIMWTKAGTWFSFDEDKMGSVEVGNFADLVIINHEFLSGDPEEIKSAKVEMTLLGGKPTFRA